MPTLFHALLHNILYIQECVHNYLYIHLYIQEVIHSILYNQKILHNILFIQVAVHNILYIQAVVQLVTDLNIEGIYNLTGTGLSLLPLYGSGALNVKVKNLLFKKAN